MLKSVKIGNVNIDFPVGLAPLAGISDKTFRNLCIECGAGYVCTEMVSAKAIVYKNKNTGLLLESAEGEHPSAVQLFGSDPQIMAQAAKKALLFSPDFIDINMGCPAPKVAGNGGGSALMREPELAAQIVRAVVNAVNVPVTVKMRTGYDNENINAPELAKMCEDAGAAAITVHGRTRPQMYAPGVDYKTIERVRRSVSVPVIGNGDVTDGKSAKYMYEATGCDFVSVGRAAEGNPFVFARIAGDEPPMTVKKAIDMHMDILLEIYPEHKVVNDMKKHFAFYLKGMRKGKELKMKAFSAQSIKQLKEIAENL